MTITLSNFYRFRLASVASYVCLSFSFCNGHFMCSLDYMWKYFGKLFPVQKMEVDKVYFSDVDLLKILFYGIADHDYSN